MKPTSEAPKDGTPIVALNSFWNSIRVIYFREENGQWIDYFTDDVIYMGRTHNWLCTADEAKEILERECQ